MNGDSENFSLPAWAYTDPEFLALERERIFRPSWQVICHLSEIPRPGDYQCFDFIGEMLFALRGNDGQVRVFHNVCRHRAARLLDGPRGSCTRRIVCPYHAWSYNFDGKLASVGGDRSAFPDFDITRESLVPVEMEIYQGFVFARIQGSGPSVAEMMAPYHDEVVTHEFEKLEPIGRVTLRPRTVNWKNVGDNYSDALHIPVAHPGLTRLLGASYGVESKGWVDRMWGDISEKPSKNWSERMYQHTLPDSPNLAAGKRRSWVYFKLWPNFAFDCYPDQVDIMDPFVGGRTAGIWSGEERSAGADRTGKVRRNRPVHQSQLSVRRRERPRRRPGPADPCRSCRRRPGRRSASPRRGLPGPGTPSR